MATTSMLTRREATLRSSATACLTGIALVQAMALPSVLARGAHFAVLALAAMTLCIGLSLALAAAPASVGQQLWGVVAAAGVVVVAGWAVPRAFAVPGLARDHGRWVGMPGALAGALGATCVTLAAIAVPAKHAAARPVAVGTMVLAALTPGVGALLAAFGPGLRGGETTLAAGGHVHSHAALEESQIRFQRLSDGRGGHFVYQITATPHQTALGVALIVLAALVFTYGLVGCLRRRATPSRPRRVAISDSRGRQA